MIPTGSRKIVVNTSFASPEEAWKHASKGADSLSKKAWDESSRLEDEHNDGVDTRSHIQAARQHEGYARDYKKHLAGDLSGIDAGMIEHVRLLMRDHGVAARFHRKAHDAQDAKQSLDALDPTDNAIGFDGKHWPGRGEDEEDPDEFRTPAKLFK
jgi:hypothetical protein